MARKLEDKPNVIAPDGTYPYGRIKDNTGANDGTPVNELVYGDFHQFFAKMAAAAGITLNGLPENLTNGFQYFDALQAVINASLVGLLELKGNIDASANPNYPAASKGDSYVITVAGKVGGASGKVVQIGDYVIAKADNAGGTEASVGTNWFIVQANVVQATESVVGFAMVASNVDVAVGTDDTKMITPLKLTSTYENWHVIGGVGEPAFQNSWIAPSGYSARFKTEPKRWISFSGQISSGSNGTVAFTLPAGYRPSQVVVLAGYGILGGAGIEMHRIEIGTNGDVTVFFSSTTVTSLEGLRFSLD